MHAYQQRKGKIPVPPSLTVAHALVVRFQKRRTGTSGRTIIDERGDKTPVPPTHP